MQELSQCKLLFIFLEISTILDLLSFIKSPSLKLIIKNLKVLILLRMHSSLNLFLMFLLFLLSKLILLLEQLHVSIISQLSQWVCLLAWEPSTDMALNEQSRLFSLLLPHFRGEVWFRIYELIFTLINIQIILLHLSTELSHHDSALCLVLICLHLSLMLLCMVGCSLICLGECMVIDLTTLVWSETAYVRLGLWLLLDLNCHDFNLHERLGMVVCTWLSARRISTSNILGMTNSSVSIESK